MVEMGELIERVVEGHGVQSPRSSSCCGNGRLILSSPERGQSSARLSEEMKMTAQLIDQSRAKVGGLQYWAVVFVLHILVNHVEAIVLSARSRIFRKFSISSSVGEPCTEGLMTARG